MFSRNTTFPAAGMRRRFRIVLGATAAMATTPVLAAEVSSGNNDVSLTLSGQVNRALLWADDGTSSRVFHVDNDNSSTRMRLVGNGRLNQDVDVGAQIEVEIESDSSSTINIDGVGAGGTATFAERKLEIYFDHKRYGKLWLGQGDTASNGVSEVDLSGTAVVTYSAIADMAGGIEFGGTPISDVYTNMDGLSRDDRIRYDSPSLSGFTISASNAESAKYDIAARFAGDLGGGLRIAAAAGYAVDKNVGADPFDSQISGSVSLMSRSGFNITGAFGVKELEGAGTQDPTFLYVKAGYMSGSNAFSVDFGAAEEIDAAGEEFSTIGAAYVRKFDNAGTEVYIGGRLHSLDTAANPDDILAVLAGARVKF